MTIGLATTRRRPAAGQPPRSSETSILFVGAGAAWAGGAGYLERQRMFIEALQEVGRVRLVMLMAPGEQVVDPPEGWNVRMLAWPARRARGCWERLASEAIGGRPESLRAWSCAGLRAAIASEEPERFDAIFAYRIDHAFLAGVLGMDRLLLDIDDPEHVRRRRRHELQGGRRARAEVELRRLERFERRAAREAARVFVCHEGDAGAFESARVVVVPNCVTLPDPARASRATSARIVMLGNFAGGPESPNADALGWFVSSVWPLVRAQRPDASLDVVGRMREGLSERLAGEPGVFVRGFAGSLEHVFMEAAASVAPIRFGTGTRVKILESMAHGCPVVSTSIGCEGIGAVAGRDLLVADDAEAFAGACVRLLEDSTLRTRIGNAGRQLVERSFDRKVNHRRLVSVLEEAIGQICAERTP